MVRVNQQMKWGTQQMQLEGTTYTVNLSLQFVLFEYEWNIAVLLLYDVAYTTRTFNPF